MDRNTLNTSSRTVEVKSLRIGIVMESSCHELSLSHYAITRNLNFQVTRHKLNNKYHQIIYIMSKTLIHNVLYIVYIFGCWHVTW